MRSGCYKARDRKARSIGQGGFSCRARSVRGIHRLRGQNKVDAVPSGVHLDVVSTDASPERLLAGIYRQFAAHRGAVDLFASPKPGERISGSILALSHRARDQQRKDSENLESDAFAANGFGFVEVSKGQIG